MHWTSCTAAAVVENGTTVSMSHAMPSTSYREDMIRLAISRHFWSNSARINGRSDHPLALAQILQLLQQLFNVWPKRRGVTAGGVPYDI